MKPSLDGVNHRLAQADEHLSYLGQVRVRYLSEPHPIIGEFDVKTGDYIFRAGGNPPLPTGLALSGFAHMLRSALDNLVWQVILLRGRRDPDSFRPHFPIKEREPKPAGQPKLPCPKCGRVPRDPWYGIDGVLAKDRAVIEEAQPYKFGRVGKVNLAQWHPLALLGHINNVDKHRYMHASVASIATVVSFGGGRYSFPIASNDLGRIYLYESDNVIVPVTIAGKLEMMPVRAFGADPVVIPAPAVLVKDEWVDPPGAFSVAGNPDDPTEIARVLDVGDPQTKMEMNPGTPLEITFTDRSRPITIMDLRAIQGYVGMIVERFRSEF